VNADVLKTYPVSETPMRRCADCFFDLQATAFQAVGRCPMFGKDRAHAELRCEKFRPRLETL